MQTIRIENGTIVRVLLWIAAFMLAVEAVLLIKTPLLWIATSFFLAVALNPPVSWLAGYLPRKSRGAAIMTVVLSFFIITGLLLLWFLPPLVNQTAALINSIPGAIDDLKHASGPVGELVRRYNLTAMLAKGSDQLVSAASSATGSAVVILKGIFDGAAAALTIFTLTFFMLLESKRWQNYFWALHPERMRADSQRLAHQMYRAVTGYVNGNLFTSAIAGLSTMILLTALGVPYAVPLGVLVAFLDLIPLVGATIAATIVVIISAFTSIPAAVIMGIFYIIYQQIENNVLQPLVYGKSTQLSPLIVTIAIIVGATIAGLFGALVAIPVAASIKVLLVHRFGDRISDYQTNKSKSAN
jgi:predicted PurR-regulated permease PerM